MLEGLWVTGFVEPKPSEVDLLSGVLVIETNRILGGDSGYVYIGEVGDKDGQFWPVKVTAKKHDDRIEGYFSDEDEAHFTGQIIKDPNNPAKLLVRLVGAGQGLMIISLSKAADLPGA